MGCNYFALPLTPASGTTLLIWNTLLDLTNVGCDHSRQTLQLSLISLTLNCLLSLTPFVFTLKTSVKWMAFPTHSEQHFIKWFTPLSTHFRHKMLIKCCSKCVIKSSFGTYFYSVGLWSGNRADIQDLCDNTRQHKWSNPTLLCTITYPSMSYISSIYKSWYNQKFV